MGRTLPRKFPRREPRVAYSARGTTRVRAGLLMLLQTGLVLSRPAQHVEPVVRALQWNCGEGTGHGGTPQTRLKLICTKDPHT